MSDRSIKERTLETASRDQSDVRRATSRRKLLKTAAVASPAAAVFTLPSSAAAYALGSFAECVRRTSEQPAFQHTGNRDAWARAERSGTVKLALLAFNIHEANIAVARLMR